MLLFRKIEKERWKWGEKKLNWLTQGEMPAAPLSDLRTSKTSILSVWFIENDRSNLERVVAAMAANLQHVDKFDCIIFPTNLLETVSIPIKTARGQTADNDANQRWHRN